MDSSIKSLTITGSAAIDAQKPRRGVGGRATSRKKNVVDVPEEEPDKPDITNKRIVFGQSSQVTQAVPPTVGTVMPIPPPVAQAVSPTVGTVVPIRATVPVAPPVAPATIGNVILNPPKHQKVKLHPKAPIQAKAAPVAHTRKARRVHLVNLTQRFTRAKRVRDDTQKQPMDSIRTYLIQKGVIQAKSKAPEKMLRSMYSDFMLLKDNAL